MSHNNESCCLEMEFAVRHALVRLINGPYFGPDVLPHPLTKKIVACPWCGKRVEERVKRE